MFCSITLFQIVRFEKFLHKQGLFFLNDHFKCQQSYVIFKIEHFIPYFCLSQYYSLCVYISHIFTFQVQFWSPWMTIWNLLFYVDLETSWKIKLICVPAHCYWSIPFSAVNCVCFFFFFFFWTFSHVCQKYVAEVLIIHFCNYYHQRFLSPYEYQSCSPISVQPELIVGGSTPEKSGVNCTFFCLQKSFCCTWLVRLITFGWSISQKATWFRESDVPFLVE